MFHVISNDDLGKKEKCVAYLQVALVCLVVIFSHIVSKNEILAVWSPVFFFSNLQLSNCGEGEPVLTVASEWNPLWSPAAHPPQGLTWMFWGAFVRTKLVKTGYSSKECVTAAFLSAGISFCLQNCSSLELFVFHTVLRKLETLLCINPRWSVSEKTQTSPTGSNNRAMVKVRDHMVSPILTFDAKLLTCFCMTLRIKLPHDWLIA